MQGPEGPPGPMGTKVSVNAHDGHVDGHEYLVSHKAGHVFVPREMWVNLELLG